MDQQLLPNDVLEFIKNNRLGVLATVSPNHMPEAAFVYYGSDEELHIYCCTFKDSRKFHNITSNKRVAFVIGQEIRAMTLQLEGTARIISNSKEKTEVMEKYAKKATANPESVFFPPLVSLTAESPMEFLEITIEWFKFSVFESHFPLIIEGKPHSWKEHSIK